VRRFREVEHKGRLPVLREERWEYTPAGKFHNLGSVGIFKLGLRLIHLPSVG
jgi:hypothetical protein